MLALPMAADQPDTNYDCTPATFSTQTGGPGVGQSVTVTWYDNGPLGLSACHYSDPTLPGGSTKASQYYAAVSSHMYDDNICGACAEITDKSNGNKVTVMITDECPKASNATHCSDGSYHLDISQNAFDDLRPLVTGVFDVSWKVVPCPNNFLNVKGQNGANLTYQFKSGASAGWATIIIRDYVMPIDTVEYCSGPGTGCSQAAWQRPYNGWVPTGSWSNFYLRITDKSGNQQNFGPIACCSPAGLDSKTETQAVYGNVPGGQMPGCGPVATATRTRTPLGTNTHTPNWTATPTRTSTPLPADCPLLLNSCESAAVNGSWSGANATRTWVNDAGSVTQGTNAMRVQINTAAAFNASIANLGGFTPTNWTGVTRLTMDVYVPLGLEPWGAASTFHQITLQGAAASVSKYQQDIAAANMPINVGMNNLSFDLTFPNSINPGDPMSDIFIALNLNGQRTGVLYIDNIVLHTDAICPPASPTSTYTRTPTVTLTRTPTPSQTPSRTLTFTSSHTPAYSPTFTFTPSFTRTPTSTFTVTGTLTSTRTASPAITPTFTATRTDSPTASSTRSPTPTFSVTPTGTPSRTATVTATSSRTITATFTRTDTPQPGSPTFTMTNTTVISPTFTATSSRTATVTQTLTPVPSTFTFTRTTTPSSTLTSSPTLTATRTATITLTGTPTASPLPGSPTFTFTLTPFVSSTFTATLTRTPTATASATVSVSGTGTPTATHSASATLTRTQTSSFTTSPTPLPGSPTFTMTLTSTPTHTRSSTPTPSSSRTQTPTFSATTTALPGTATSTVTPTQTAARATAVPTTAPEGPNEIEKHAVGPNPNPGHGSISVKLKGRVDSVRVRVYSKSMICIGESSSGALQGGWRQVPLPVELAGQTNGLYYYQVKSMRNGSENHEPGIGSFMLLK